MDAQLKERRRARVLLASVTLEQEGRQARETMAACRQQLEARAKPYFAQSSGSRRTHLCTILPRLPLLLDDKQV